MCATDQHESDEAVFYRSTAVATHSGHAPIKNAAPERKVGKRRDVLIANGPKGSRALIRQGAGLVAAPEDILGSYGIAASAHASTPQAAGDPEEILVSKALAEIATATDVDKSVAMTRLEPRIVDPTVRLLIIRGTTKEIDPGYTI